MKNKKFISKVLFVIATILLSISLFGKKEMQKYIPAANSPIYMDYNFLNVSEKLPLREDVTYSVENINFDEPNMFIFYKIGCPLCDAAHSYINEKYEDLKGNYNIYYVSVDSALYSHLNKEYVIDRPFVILVTNKSEFYKYKQVKEDEDGNNMREVSKSNVNESFEKLTSLVKEYENNLGLTKM